jgi:hypothetical protein
MDPRGALDRRGIRVVAAKPVGKRAVNPIVIFLVGDRRREDFLLIEIGESFHVRLPIRVPGELL